jgi:hypothetical protein
MKPAAPISAATEIQGRAMTKSSNTIRGIAIRAVAFVALTTASTVVLALPYMG